LRGHVCTTSELCNRSARTSWSEAQMCDCWHQKSEELKYIFPLEILRLAEFNTVSHSFLGYGHEKIQQVGGYFAYKK
jgi:hypothetical protein